jgi:RND family efflux transporter MFP subunit
MMDGQYVPPTGEPLSLAHEVAEDVSAEDGGGHTPDQERRRRRTARRLGAGALVIVAFLVAAGAWGHAQRHARAVDFLAHQQNVVPVVRTVTMKAVDTPRTIDLPANLQAFDIATIYARATGYIAKREVDIGSHVRAGDLLAIIAAPDLDQQLSQAQAQLVQTEAALTQAQATLQQAQANLDLAKVTNERYSQLVVHGYASHQDADNARLTLAARNADVANAVAAVSVANANVKAQKANVGRLEQLTSFERVTAPFDGVITTRQIDAGDLVTADANSGTPMFSMARTKLLRVQVYVPQDAVFGLKDGDPAEVLVPEMPGHIFHGVVARHAGALQAGTRTLLTEVDVDNQDGALTPGLYGIVRLSIPRPHPVVVLPSNAVIFDGQGLSAAVDEDGIVHLRHIELAEDDGAQVVVQAGLAPGDRVILSPPADVADGMRVETAGVDRRVAEDSAPNPNVAKAPGK